MRIIKSIHELLANVFNRFVACRESGDLAKRFRLAQAASFIED